MASSLVSFSNDLASVVEQTAASVVAVHARPRFHSSGIHWSPGVVVTADHTLYHDEDIFVTTASGEKFAAEIAGRDPGTDIAVLRVKDLAVPVATRGDAGTVRPGSLIVSVARNKDSVNAALGVIGSVGAASQTWRGGKLDAVIRLDVELYPSAAGGAIVDAAGKLIGIATPALSRVAVFAVPNSTVERVVTALLAHGKMPQGYLGAGLQPIELPEHLIKSLGLASNAGLMTVSVDDTAPAGKAGLLIGDVLLEFAGQPVKRTESLRPLLAEAVGKTVTLRLLRGGTLVNLEVTVAERQGRE
jgi:S1-C subfamily serine protease